jgi:chemotaxis protein methyltransferase CheR
MASATLPVLGDREFKHLQALMAEVSGIRMSEHKRPLMAGRLMRRLRVLGLSSYSDYLALLSDSKQQEERRLVIDLLTTNETYFFREPQHFSFLTNWLGGQQGPLRLWSAACSSGEEPYSLAMVLAEHARHEDWSILASDLSLRMLERARAAVYEMQEAKEFPAGWLQRHCLRGIGEYEGKFRMAPALRARVTLREINLMRPLPEDADGFDLIFLRNVLIYFAPEDKRAIVERLLERLRPGGLLFIGHAESLHGLGLPLRTVAPSVYRQQ